MTYSGTELTSELLANGKPWSTGDLLRTMIPDEEADQDSELELVEIERRERP